MVVDAALELRARGHRVTIFTGAHDPTHAFEETRDGRLDIRVHGAFLPLHIAGRFRAVAAIAKLAVGAIAIACDADRPDVIFCDVAPHAIPILRAFCPHAPVVFYCHFPDRLLARARTGFYAWYRMPIDALEAVGTAMAARVLVNSHYTAGVFVQAYPELHLSPEIVYPGVDLERWIPLDEHGRARTTVVSVARFERSKNVILAIKAFARLRDILPARAFAPLRIAIAGGFDARLAEAAATLEDMRAFASESGLADRVDYFPSCSHAHLHALLAGALCVAYTPENEHFGYVPVEAMACARPVVAVSSGGPLETVLDGETGFLVAPTAEAFASAMARLVLDPVLADRMGAAGRARAALVFSRASFGAGIDAAVRAAAAVRR